MTSVIDAVASMYIITLWTWKGYCWLAAQVAAWARTSLDLSSMARLFPDGSRATYRVRAKQWRF